MEIDDFEFLSSFLETDHLLDCIVLRNYKIQKPFYIFKVNEYMTITGFTLFPKTIKYLKTLNKNGKFTHLT